MTEIAEAYQEANHLRPPGERQRLLQDFEVDHDQLRDGLDFIGRFHFPVKGGSPQHGRIGILAGESRTGKSYAVLRYVRSFPSLEGESGKIFPVVYVETPGVASERAFLEAIANALEIPHHVRTKGYELLNNVLKNLREHKVDLLIFDEFQDAFDSKKPGLTRAVRKILRKILNIKPAAPSIVCVGLLETYDLMRGDSQITGRGGLQYRILRPYDRESVDGRQSFRLLCGVIDKVLPFEMRSGLYQLETSERLHFVTGGSIGRLKDFLFAAGAMAINEDAPRIEYKHFAQAYDEQKPPGTSFNAFRDDLVLAPKEPAPDLDGISSSAAMTKGGKRGRRDRHPT